MLLFEGLRLSVLSPDRLGDDERQGTTCPDTTIIPYLLENLQIDPNTLFSKADKEMLEEEGAVDYDDIKKNYSPSNFPRKNSNPSFS